MQLDRAGLLAAEFDTADDEQHVIAFQSIDELCQCNVISGEIGFHLDRLQSAQLQLPRPCIWPGSIVTPLATASFPN